MISTTKIKFFNYVVIKYGNPAQLINFLHKIKEHLKDSPFDHDDFIVYVDKYDQSKSVRECLKSYGSKKDFDEVTSILTNEQMNASICFAADEYGAELKHANYVLEIIKKLQKCPHDKEIPDEIQFIKKKNKTNKEYSTRILILEYHTGTDYGRYSLTESDLEYILGSDTE